MQILLDTLSSEQSTRITCSQSNDRRASASRSGSAGRAGIRSSRRLNDSAKMHRVFIFGAFAPFDRFILHTTWPDIVPNWWAMISSHQRQAKMHVISEKRFQSCPSLCAQEPHSAVRSRLRSSSSILYDFFCSRFISVSHGARMCMTTLCRLCRRSAPCPLSACTTRMSLFECD